MNKIHASIFVCFSGFLLCAHSVTAADPFGLDRLGVRGGPDNDDRVTVFSYEIYGIADTPWSWEIVRGTRLSVEIEGAIGGLSGEGDTNVYARLAPQLRLGFDSFPISVVAGPGLVILSDPKFGDELDLGGNFQFFTSAGFDWHLGDAWTVGYRFQHISNADIHETNPSLNLQTLGIDYSF